MKEIKLQYWIPIEWVQLTNDKIDQKKVDRIARDFDMDRVGAMPGRFEYVNNPKCAGEFAFTITDGNHRVSAMLQLGIRYIPIIILTDLEYVTIAYEKEHINFIVERSNQIIPERVVPFFWRSLPLDQRLDKFFTFGILAKATYENFGHTKKEKKAS